MPEIVVSDRGIYGQENTARDDSHEDDGIFE